MVRTVLILAIFALLAVTGSSTAAKTQPPNVVMIVSDDQAWTDFGFMGHEVIKTPHLDRLAAESAVFPNGYVPTSLCRASLATLLTGLYGHQHKICCNDPPRGIDRSAMLPFLHNAPTIPRLLQQRGYRSFQTGKFWEGHYQNGGFTDGMTVKGRHGDDGLVIGRQTMQPMVDFIEKDRTKPFFLWYAPMLPHEPHDPPERLLAKYRAPGRPEALARYWANVERFDETCGELLAYLDRQGLRDNTLVMFVVDNGWIQETNPQPRRFRRGNFADKSKLSPYDGGLRTPVILRWPGHSKAGRYDDLVSTIDFAPTVLNACGVRAPAKMPGVNLLPRASGGGALKRDAVFGELYVHTAIDLERPSLNLTHRWVRSGEWKLIDPVDPASGPELYRLTVDPFENKNLAASEPGQVRRLSAQLERWWDGFRDDTPFKPLRRQRSARAAPARRPNFIVLLCDDLGYGDLACFGSKIIRTPNLDRMAAEGMRLTDFYSGQPVCSPSRAALMTGRIPNRLGIRDWIPPNSGIFLRKEETTVAEVLKARGYRTALFGKWHLNSRMDGTEPTPGDHGFDEWLSTQNNAEPSHQNPTNWIRNGKPVGPTQGHASVQVVDEAVRFVDKNRDRPFALFVTFHAPHEPISTPPDVTAMYAGFQNPLQPQYYGSVSLVDQQVGRLRASLRELGLDRTTVVLFSSDNGPETLKRYRGSERSFGSPGPLRGMKLHLYEGGYRVPGIVTGPGILAGSESDQPAGLIDVLPTLCELAGAPVPAERPLDGASFAPLLHGKTIHRRQPLYWEYDRAIGGPWKIALRDGDWKLLATPDLTRFELYNLRQDLSEAHNLSAEEPERAASLLAAARTIHQSIATSR